jgi:hypothetical protein
MTEHDIDSSELLEIFINNDDQTIPKSCAHVLHQQAATPEELLEVSSSYNCITNTSITATSADTDTCRISSTTRESPATDEIHQVVVNMKHDTSNNSKLVVVICAVCLESYKAGDILSWSTNMLCKHVFHFNCIVPWLLKNNFCPMCRTDLLAVKSKGLKPCSSRGYMRTSTSSIATRTGGEEDNSDSDDVV